MKTLSTKNNSSKNNSTNHEVIDRLFYASLIDQNQQHAGITFRVLRYKKFGKSSCTAKKYDNLQNHNIVANDNDEFNEKILSESLAKLRDIKAESAVLDTCVYNIPPKNVLILNKVKEGLKLLAEFYDKSFFSIR